MLTDNPVTRTCCSVLQKCKVKGLDVVVLSLAIWTFHVVQLISSNQYENSTFIQPKTFLLNCARSKCGHAHLSGDGNGFFRWQRQAR